MMHALLLWIGFVLTFVAGLVIGFAIQAKHDAKAFRNIETAFEAAVRDAKLARVLKFPTAEELMAREKAPTLNIVKGFDDDD